MVDKSYYLSKTEFCILTALEGAGRFYCFDLDIQKETDGEKIIQSSYQIVKNGWGYLEGSRLVACGEMKELIKEIVQSESVIEIFNNPSGKTLCYLGRQIILLSAVANDALRISSQSYDEFLSWLDNVFSLGKPYWKTEEDAQEDIKSNEALWREKNFLRDGQREGLLHRCKVELVIRNVKTGAVSDRYILIQGVLNLWFVHTDGENEMLWLVPDSDECRRKMQGEWKERSR